MPDFTGSPAGCFTAGQTGQGPQVCQSSVMFQGEQQEVTPHMAMTDSYQDSYLHPNDKPKHLVTSSADTQNVLLSSAPSAPIQTEINLQHQPVTAEMVQTLQQNPLNTQNNSEDVNKEVFNQIEDDQSINSPQIPALHNQMAVGGVPAQSQYYHVMKSINRFDGENNQFKDPTDPTTPAYHKSNMAGQGQGMRIVPGVPVPQMPFVSNAGQHLMVPVAGNSGPQQTGPAMILPSSQARFVGGPVTHPPPPPPPTQVNYNNSLSRDQISTPPDHMGHLGLSGPAAPAAPAVSGVGMVLAGALQQPAEKVSVPWGWKRVFMGDQVVYFR